MRILVTRPEDDAGATAAKLKSLGHDAIAAPLLEIRFLENAEIDLKNVQAILATSANAIRAFERASPVRDIRVLAVGPQTAEAARRAGFARVENAGGDAATLAKAAARWENPQDGALLHVQGQETRGGLSERLRALGYDVRSAVLYEAAAVESLPRDAAEALQSGTLEAALFYSPRSARIFFNCVVNAGLAQTTAKLAALCISKPTAGALSPLNFRAVHVAPAPNQEAMLRLVAEAAPL